MFTTPGLPAAVFEALVRASVMDRMCANHDGAAAATCACKRVLASRPKSVPIFRDTDTARPTGTLNAQPLTLNPKT